MKDVWLLSLCHATLVRQRVACESCTTLYHQAWWCWWGSTVKGPTGITVKCDIGKTEHCLWKLHNSLSPGPVMLIRFDCERSDWFDCLAYDCSENWLWLWKTSEEMNSTSAWVFVCVFLHNVASFKLVSHSVSIWHCILWLFFFSVFTCLATTQREYFLQHDAVVTDQSHPHAFVLLSVAWQLLHAGVSHCASHP